VVFFVSMHYGAPWWAAALLGITVGSLVGSVLFVLGAIVVGMIAVSRESR
jgi:tetrahydromethanopterin S-methyltransferase subunit C